MSYLQMNTPEIVQQAAEVVRVLTQSEAPDESAVLSAVEAVDDNQKADLITQVQERLKALDPEIVKTASENLRKLNITITGNKLDALKGAVEETAAAVTEGGTGIGGFFKSVGDSMEGVTDSFLSKEQSESWSRKKKILTSIGAAAVVYTGVRWLFRRAKKARAAGGEAAAEASGGFVKKLAIGLGVGALAFGSLKAYELYKEVGSIKGMFGAMKDEILETVSNPVDTVKEFTGLGSSEEKVFKYGLTEDRYKEARKMYRTSKPLDDIKQEVFGLASGATSDEWEQFAEDMEKEFAPEKDKTSSIEFTPISVSVDSYESTAENICVRLVRWMDQHKTLTTLGAIGLARIGVLQRILSGSGSALMRLGSAGKAMASMGLRNHKVVGLFALFGVLAGPKLAKVASENVRMPKNMSELLKACSLEDVPTIKGAALGQDLASLSNEIGKYGKVVGEVSGDISQWATDEAVNLFDNTLDVLVSDDAEVIASNHQNTFGALRRQLLIDESHMRESGDIELAREQLQHFGSARAALDAYQDLFLMHRIQEDAQDVPMLSSALKELKNALAPLDLIIAYRSDRLVWFDKNDPDNALDFGVVPMERNHEIILEVSQNLDAGESLPDRLFASAIQRLRMEQNDNAEDYPDKNSWMAMVVGNLLYVADPENVTQYFVVSMDSVTSLFDSDESWGDWAATVGDTSMQTALMTLGPALGVRLASKAIGVVPLYGIKMQALRNFAPILGQFDVLNEFRRLGGGGINLLQYGVLEGRKITTVLTQLRYEKEWFRIVARTTDINELYHVAAQAGIDLKHLKQSAASLSVVRKELKEGMVAAMNAVKTKGFLRRINLLSRLRGEKVARTLRGGDVLFDTLASAPTTFQTLQSALSKSVDLAKAVASPFQSFYAKLSALRSGVNVSAASIKAFIVSNIAVLQAAAAGGNRAAIGLLKVGTWLKVGGRGVGRALPVLSVIIDTVLIGANELDIREAEAAGQTNKVSVLKSKRTSLGISGGAGLALFTANPLIMAPAGLIIGAGMFSNAVYDSIITWENSREDWLNYPPEELVARMRERKIGYADIGQRTGAGHSGFWAMYRWGRSWTTSGKEKNDREDDKAYGLVEGVNKHVRQELLAAYFLQTLRIPNVPNETPEQTQARITKIVQDCMSYVSAMTLGTYDVSSYAMERFTNDAQSYVELMNMRRVAKKEGQDLKVGYQWDDQEKTLDLNTLDYVINPTAEVDSMDFFRTVHQYQEEVSLVQMAMLEINGIDLDLDTSAA